MNLKLTIKDFVWCYFTGLKDEHLNILYNEFGPFVDGYFFSPKYKIGVWDGRVRFFQKTGKTYIRLLDQILPFIEKWGYEIELIDNRPCVELPTLRSKDIFTDIIMGGRPFAIRPYQVSCIDAAIEEGSGFLICGTGSGKTTMTAGISQIYSASGFKVITIVPSGDLVEQTARWYEALGMDVGIYSGKEKNLEPGNIVATWQAIQYNPEIMSMFQVLIWDEAHGVSAAVAGKIINEHGKHIEFRFGVTGTFPKVAIDKMTLLSSIGRILKEVPASWLIDNGYLAKISIQPVIIDETYITEDFPDYSAERSFVSKSTGRMEKIADIIISQCATKGNTLVLVNSIAFGKKLSALIKDSVFLYGEHSTDIRKEHYDMFDKRNDLIVIASSGIASTGISINRIFCLILVDPMKSFVKAIQSIGRGLRLADDKDKISVIDIHSKLKWGKKHFKERKKYYVEAGYPVEKPITIKVK